MKCVSVVRKVMATLCLVVISRVFFNPTDGSASNSSTHLARSDNIPQFGNSTSSANRSHRHSYHPGTHLTIGATAAGAAYITKLRDEVIRLRAMLSANQSDQLNRAEQERNAMNENARLRRLLQAETERREALSRNFSGSESSLEMEDERFVNVALSDHGSSSLHNPLCISF